MFRWCFAVLCGVGFEGLTDGTCEIQMGTHLFRPQGRPAWRGVRDQGGAMVGGQATYQAARGAADNRGAPGLFVKDRPEQPFELPEEDAQLPDLFLYITGATSNGQPAERLYFKRFSAQEILRAPWAPRWLALT